MVVLIVLCFGVEFLCCLHLMFVSYFLSSLCNLVTANWEIAAHSAYDMLSKYKYLIVNLFFSLLGFWNFFQNAPFPDHYLLLLLNGVYNFQNKT